MRMGRIPAPTRSGALALRKFTDVITAALTGGEDDVRTAVEALDRRDLARLANAFRLITLITDQHETRLRRLS